MKNLFRLTGLITAGFLYLTPAQPQSLDQTYYRLDGANSGSLLNIGKIPPNPACAPGKSCSPWLNIPVNPSLFVYQDGAAPNTNEAVAKVRSYMNGVRGGTYGSVQTIFTPYWADSVMSTQGQNMFGYGKGLGKGNNNTINSLMDCWAGSALNETGSIPSCGFGESDYLTGPYTFQTFLANDPGPGGTTLNYDPTTVKHEDALGARFLLNKNTMIAGDGVAVYVSSISGKSITFAGISLPAQPGTGHYYIKLSAVLRKWAARIG